MTLRQTRILLLLVAAALIAGILYLAGLFTSKISAGRTAAQEQIPSARSVHCRSGSHGWDYTCSVTLPNGAVREISVDVNSHDITDQGG